jgi:hypothetical protein
MAEADCAEEAPAETMGRISLKTVRNAGKMAAAERI